LAFSGYLSLQQYKDAPDLRALITYSTEQDKPSIFEIKPPISGIGGTGLTAKTLARAGFETKRLPLERFDTRAESSYKADERP
jgi:hypothetical protein